MATYSMAYQLGAALGAPIFGFVIQLLGFEAMFVGCALALAAGLAWSLLRWPALAHSARGQSPAAARMGRA
jgi:predicted MFS family arabinose efflux permease